MKIQVDSLILSCFVLYSFNYIKVMKQKGEINLEYKLFILLNNIIKDVNDSDN